MIFLLEEKKVKIFIDHRVTQRFLIAIFIKGLPVNFIPTVNPFHALVYFNFVAPA